MERHFRHGQRVTWTAPKCNSKTILLVKHGVYIRPVDKNRFGLVWCKFDGNGTRTKCPVYEIAHE